jgi:tripartite ATP-independent transporter DctM subunit
VIVATLIAVFAALMLLGVPIAFAMGVAAIVVIPFAGGVPMQMLTHRLVMSADSFTLLAIPLFVLAGALMETGGIASKLVNLAKALVGFIRGGLGMAVIVGEMFFSGISGSTTADVSAMASMLLPSMKRSGYPQEQSVAIISASSAMGILIPPCITMVVFGGVTNTSVAALFLAGFLPALVLAVLTASLVYYYALRLNLPTAGHFSLRNLWRASVDSLIALGMPVMIFGGLIFGVATTTEVASFAVVYAALVGFFVYRELTLAKLWRILVESSVLSGVILLLLGLSVVYTYLLAIEDITPTLGKLVLGFSRDPTVFLVITSVIAIVLGAVIEVLPTGLLLIPIFLPLAQQLGVDKIHFLTLLVAAGGLGMFLPPTGVGLLIGCSVGNIPVTRAVRPMLPYVMVLFFGIVVLCAFPSVTTIVPRLVLGH